MNHATRNSGIPKTIDPTKICQSSASTAIAGASVRGFRHEIPRYDAKTSIESYVYCCTGVKCRTIENDGERLIFNSKLYNLFKSK
jgi:hypothetical protein